MFFRNTKIMSDERIINRILEENVEQDATMTMSRKHFMSKLRNTLNFKIGHRNKKIIRIPTAVTRSVTVPLVGMRRGNKNLPSHPTGPTQMLDGPTQMLDL
jgi:hypothetical protein